jgi:polysaccharide export outer membrane protein
MLSKIFQDLWPLKAGGSVPLMLAMMLLAAPSGRPQHRAAAGGLASPIDPGNAEAYMLGPGDELSVWALGAEEISAKPIRVDSEGYLDVPLIGRILALSRTPEQIKAEIISRLRVFVKEPQVTVSVTDFHSQPVSVIGAVNKPGIQQLRGRKTLIEVLSMAEGVRNDAGNTVRITRRSDRGQIPLRNAVPDPTKRFNMAEVSLRELMEGSNPSANILIEPDDVISVSQAQTVYVIGDVHKSGGFALSEREHISVLQALSLAEGLGPNAAPEKAKILRTSASDEKRVEIAVNIKQILAGKSRDIMMEAEDILFIPNNATRNVALRAAEAALNVGTGITIWRVGLPR